MRSIRYYSITQKSSTLLKKKKEEIVITFKHLLKLGQFLYTLMNLGSSLKIKL